MTRAIELLLYPCPDSPPDRGTPDSIGAQVQPYCQADPTPAECPDPLPALYLVIDWQGRRDRPDLAGDRPTPSL